MKISSPFKLEVLGQTFLLEKRIVLLQAVKEHGSISKAAKAVPMSYKSAWEAIESMNNLASEPIVVRATGGKEGGGTMLTPFGERLLENYMLLKQEHNAFIERLERSGVLQGSTLKTIGRLSLQVSARNQWHATIENIKTVKTRATLDLSLGNGQTIQSIITADAADDLGLAVGDEVVAIVKSNALQCRPLSCQLEGDSPVLDGFVETLIRNEEGCKIVIDLGDEKKAVSFMHSGDADGISKEIRVGIWIDPSDVMIGR